MYTYIYIYIHTVFWYSGYFFSPNRWMHSHMFNRRDSSAWGLAHSQAASCPDAQTWELANMDKDATNLFHFYQRGIGATSRVSSKTN